MTNDYIKWLIEDQAIRLLRIPEEDIATIMGVCRQSFAKYKRMGTYSRLRVESVNYLIHHLEYVKAAILTTESEVTND